MLNQTQQYYDRMLSALGDKKRMLSHIVGKRVVDMGCGDGALVSYLLAEGYDAYGIDAAPASMEQVHAHPELAERVYEAYAHEGSKFFEAGTVDTILASSLLHEVYSYGLPEGKPLSMEARYETFRSWRELLPVGGRVIIRDGIVPERHDKLTSIRFKNGARFEDGKDMVAEYLNRIPFRGTGMISDYRTVNLLQTGDEEFSGSFESVMEFLYTYNWGFGSYERETQELYGLFTLEEYKANADKHGFDVIEAFEYTQPGYKEFLEPKVSVWRKGEEIELPSTNALIVLQKR